MLDRYAKVLVTGGLGFIGRHLVEALLSLKKKVVVLDNLSTVSSGSAIKGATLVRVNIRDSDQVKRAAKGAELIFHLAANANGTVSVNDLRLDFETNALGTLNALEAAISGGAERFIYASSASVYGKPKSFPIDEEHPTRPFIPYGVSKLAGELYCLSFFEAYDLGTVIARPFCVYGPGENPRTALVEVSRYLRWHLNRKPIHIVGDMDRKTRDFVHVSDVVRALLLIADKADGGEVFNIGSGGEISMKKLVEIIASVTGKPAEINEISGVREDTYRLVANISKLNSLGYAPSISLEEGVRQLAMELGDKPQMPSGATIFRRGQVAEEL